MEAAMEAERELVGVAEIAEMAKVRQSAVSNWAARWTEDTNQPFPAPVVKTRMGPVYDKADVMAWLIRTGRRRV